MLTHFYRLHTISDHRLQATCSNRSIFLLSQQFGDKSATRSNELKCYKCGENHEYNQDFANAEKCANGDGQHIAGSPECPAKILYLREKRQQVEKRETNQRQSSSYLASPARLYSNVIQAMATHVHANSKTRKTIVDRPTGHNDQSTIIINALKEEIVRSQEVLLDRIM